MKPSWRELAACKLYPSDQFFFSAEMPRADYLVRVAMARKVCDMCPVSGECLKLGMESANIDYGVWGGLSPKDRIEMRKLGGH